MRAPSVYITALSLAALLTLNAPGAAGQAVPETGESPKTAGYAQRYIELVGSTEPLKSSVWGILAVKYGGDTLVNVSSGRRMLPASNTKLITTGLALKTLGPDFRFETKLAYTGEIVEGTLNGDIYIVGGGDPTIAADDTLALGSDALFWRWKNLLTKAGIKSVNGRIIGDGRFFDGMTEVDTWSYQDIGTYYGTGGGALSFYENAQDFKVSAGAKAGDGVNVEVIYPETPWMSYSYPCVTGQAGTGDMLYLYTTDLAPVAQMRGSFAIDRKPKTENFSNKYPSYTCAWYFRNYLNRTGFKVSGDAADIDSEGNIRTDLSAKTSQEKAAKAEDLKVAGTSTSAPLKKIAKSTNYRSDNFYAEALLRMVSARSRGSASYDTCRVVSSEILKGMGLKPENVKIVDGSGLSRENYISPEFFTSFLKAMMKEDVFGDFVGSLPQPGKGTLASRLAKEPQALKDRIFMKSGSMDGVRCYSGYVVPSDGEKENTIVFSVMINNNTSPSWKTNAVLDKIIAFIASQN